MRIEPVGGAAVEVGQAFPWNTALTEKNAKGVGNDRFRGHIFAIYYVAGSAWEPEHYDVLALPTPMAMAVFQAQGLPAEQRPALMQQAINTMEQQKIVPRGQRRLYLLTNGAFNGAAVEMSLSVEDLLAHDHARSMHIVAGLEMDDVGDEEEEQDEGQAGAPTEAQPAADEPIGLPVPGSQWHPSTSPTTVG